MKRLTRTAAVFAATLAISAHIFATPVYASWGASYLSSLGAYPAGTTTTTNPVTTTPAPATTVPKPTTTPSTPTTPTIPAPAPAVGTAPAATTGDASNMTAAEKQMLQLVNNERVKNGLKPLAPMAKLTQLAQLKAKDLIVNNYFSHTSPTYGSFYTMVYNAGIRFRSVGENLAEARDVNTAFTLLMASSAHRANMLNANFTHIGIGVYQYQYGVAVSQLFIMQ